MGTYVVNCDETAKFLHISNDYDLLVYLLDLAVYNAKELGSHVMEVTQPSGIWSNDRMQTVINAD